MARGSRNVPDRSIQPNPLQGVVPAGYVSQHGAHTPRRIESPTPHGARSTMILRTEIRDCLLLSWAIPARRLPALPPPLRYEGHLVNGEKEVLVVALLFHQAGFRLAALPMLRLSYPQFCLALSIVDGQGCPAFYFRRVLLPGWLAPAAKLVASPPIMTARLEYATPSKDLAAEAWHWKVAWDRGELKVNAALATPAGMPFFPSWQQGVEYFLTRRRGYYQTPRGFRYLETCLPPVEAWPLKAELEGETLLTHHLPLAQDEKPGEWPALHSAMLFPHIPLEFERSLAPSIQFSGRVPQPAPSRRSMLPRARQE